MPTFTTKDGTQIDYKVLEENSAETTRTLMQFLP